MTHTHFDTRHREKYTRKLEFSKSMIFEQEGK